MTENNNKGMKSMRKVVIIGGVLAVLNFLAGFLAYPHLPDKVPTHWNFAGEVDGWGTAWEGAFLLPLVYLGIYLLLILVPKIDPKRRNYALMGRAYSIIVLIILLFFSAIYFATLGIALGYFENLPSLINIAIGIMFIVIGNYMGKIKHNYFMGIRTPWTLASEEVWYRTHRMAGPFWVAGGILFILMAFVPKGWTLTIFLIVMFTLLLIPTVYSYVIFRRLEQDRH